MVLGHRRRKPIHPTATEWTFPDLGELPSDEDMVAVGADLEPGTLLEAYTNGYFPMPIGRSRLGWFHPDPRGIIPPAGLKVSRSLRRSLRRFTTSVDLAFDEVIDACADPGRPLGWIDGRVMAAYRRLHQLGWAHSIEVWDDDGLAGGLYGVAIGGLFAGESMFHRRTDASKVALVALVDAIGTGPDVLLDVQWVTPHLQSLGAIEVPRSEYVRRLTAAIGAPLPPVLAGSPAAAPPTPPSTPRASGA